MSSGGKDRSGSVASSRSEQPGDGVSNTAKIIPLRPWFDASSPHAEDPPFRFTDEKAAPAVARVAEPPSVEPSMRAEAKTPPPGSTVVIEQAVPAPPLERRGTKDGGGSSGGGGGRGGGGGGGTPPLHKRSSFK